MQQNIKLGAATLTLAALVSACAPAPGTVPSAGSTTGQGGYTNPPPAATAPANNDGSYYDYGDNTSGGGTNDSNNSSYFDYGTGGSDNANNNSSNYDYYSGGSSDQGGNSYDYSTDNGGSSSYSGSSSSGGSFSSGSASGSNAVQVIASSKRRTAENMQSQMQGMGYTAVIDHVDGYYKVRIPYGSRSEAESNLGRIRNTVPDAFLTVR